MLLYIYTQVLLPNYENTSWKLNIQDHKTSREKTYVSVQQNLGTVKDLGIKKQSAYSLGKK